MAPGQLDAAVELLSHEEHEGRSFLRSTALELVEDLCVGSILFGFVVGAIVVWSHSWLGLGLMLGAVGCLALLGLLPRSGIAEASKTLRRTIEDSHVLGSSIDQWRDRRASLMTGAFLAATGPLSALAGVVWLIWAQFDTGTVPGLAIVLVAAPTFLYWLWFAYDNVSELRYFKRVSRLLDSIKRARAEESRHVSVSASEIDILTQAESHHVHRTVAEAVEQLPGVIDDSYAVSLGREPAQYLEKLAAESPEDWVRIAETLHALQADPRPDYAHPASEAREAVEVLAGRYGLEYVVDDDAQQVYVVAIDSDQDEAKRA